MLVYLHYLYSPWKVGIGVSWQTLPTQSRAYLWSLHVSPGRVCQSIRGPVFLLVTAGELQILQSKAQPYHCKTPFCAYTVYWTVRV